MPRSHLMTTNSCADSAQVNVGISMNAMTCGRDFLGGDAELIFPIGPLAAHAGTELERPAVTPFLRPGPEDLSEAIPVFFIGRNRDGLWVARDADGKSGGLFWSKEGAIRFAKQNAWPAVCGTVIVSDRLELDIENGGNPFVTKIVVLKRLMNKVIVSVRKAARF